MSYGDGGAFKTNYSMTCLSHHLQGFSTFVFLIQEMALKEKAVHK